ncbi:MAG: antitoxin [Thermodesulfobacteriota bacterium]|nr:antitoxin [Thermodesulfobacteriota bacterium]
MKEEYDFSKSVKNPYAKHLKKQVTLRLGIDFVEYFKKLSDETGVPCQNLIKIYIYKIVLILKKNEIKVGILINQMQNQSLNRTSY